MNMSTQIDFIENLLFAEEDTSLDFKRDQYAFENASKEEKSELLKDILAFVNAFRRTDAYILIGIDENRIGRNSVVGITSHLDDAKLQQFVNSKTQMPVTFSYREVSHDNSSIGIIHIPIQARPIYAKSNYGIVQKEVVYIRRGSSTDIAKPEDIMRMGSPNIEAEWQPNLKLNLVDRFTGKAYENPITLSDSTWYELPPINNIPDYFSQGRQTLGITQINIFDPWENRNYYRQLATYLQTKSCFRVSLELENISGAVALDTNLEIEFIDPNRDCEFIGSDDLPKQPERSNMTRLSDLADGGISPSDVLARREGTVWKVECQFGKVQPRSKVRLENDLLIGCRAAKSIEIQGTIYGDNIVSPITVRFSMNFLSGSRQISIQDIIKIAK